MKEISGDYSHQSWNIPDEVDEAPDTMEERYYPSYVLSKFLTFRAHECSKFNITCYPALESCNIPQPKTLNLDSLVEAIDE